MKRDNVYFWGTSETLAPLDADWTSFRCDCWRLFLTLQITRDTVVYKNVQIYVPLKL